MLRKFKLKFNFSLNLFLLPKTRSKTTFKNLFFNICPFRNETKKAAIVIVVLIQIQIQVQQLLLTDTLMEIANKTVSFCI